MGKKTTNLEHQKLAIELVSNIIASDNYLSANQIIEEYAQNSPEKEKGEKSVGRSIKTVMDILGEEIIESKTGKGYRLKKKYKEKLSWMLPLLSKYLIITEPESLNFVFEPITFQLQKGSLFNLVLLHQARSKRKAIQFLYTKYGETKPTERKIHVYSIVLRDRKLLIMGRDCMSKREKHFFFTEMQNIKILDETFPKPDSNLIKEYYHESISIFKADNKTKVRIRFSPEAKTFIHKEFFHQNQKIEEDEHGFILELFASNKREIFNIVSQFMNYTELLEPLDWRIEYSTELEKLLNRHKKTD